MIPQLIVEDIKLIAVIEEERLNRDKLTQAFPRLAIERCIEIAGLTFEVIDYIVVSILRFRRIDYWQLSTIKEI
jgi:predicted NodU family carbamoyl transferase